MEYDDFSDIQILAIKDVLRPDWAATYRQIQRWYSKTFATPLHQVADLDVEFVLQHYLEDKYLEMKLEDRLQTALNIVETDAERAERLRAEEAAAQAMVDTASQMLSRATAKAQSMGKSLSALAAEFHERMALSLPKSSSTTSLDEITAQLKGLPQSLDGFSISEDDSFGLPAPKKKV